MQKKVIAIILILSTVLFLGFAEDIKEENESNRAFFYYITNLHLKSNFTMGYHMVKYRIKDYSLTYVQHALALNGDLCYQPSFSHDFIFLGGFDVKVPFSFKRMNNEQTQNLENFKDGMYTTLSPYLGIGLLHTFRKNPKNSWLGALGFKYDHTCIRSLVEKKERLKAVSALAVFNFKHHINERYSLTGSLKGQIGLKHWIEGESYKIDSFGFTAQFGISYDF